MKLEIHVFIPYQGQLRVRYDDETDAIQRMYKSDPEYDRLVIPSEAHHHGKRPITCRELVYATTEKRDEWGHKLCDIIESKLRQFFKHQRPYTCVSHDFGPTTGMPTDGRINAVFCLVSK